MAESAEKFNDQDLPKILAALETARKAGAKGSVIVQFDQNGGVLSVVHEAKRTFK
jgi:hypothetical protein